MQSNYASAQKFLGSIERKLPKFDQLVGADAKIEILAEGFTWTEGPVWMGGRDGHLLFSDIPRNSIFKWRQDGTISLFMSPSGYTGERTSNCTFGPEGYLYMTVDSYLCRVKTKATGLGVFSK